MQIYNYNKEKKDSHRADVYLKFGLFGVFVALMFIGGAKLLAWLLKFIIKHFKFIIKHWIWVIVLLAMAFLFKHFFIRRKKK
jgi:cobalamin biosynthesis protein CobD/CbiB